MKMFSVFSRRILAEAFAMTLMFYHRWLFIVYRHNQIDELMLGTEKAVQRWEQCLAMFRKYTPSAVEFLYTRKNRDEISGKAAEMFAGEVIEYFGKYLENRTEISSECREKAVNRITSLKLIVGLPEEISTETKLEKFYEELQLKGNENIVKSYFEMCKFHRKIENELKNDWRWRLEEISVQEDMKYIAMDNTLCRSFQN